MSKLRFAGWLLPALLALQTAAQAGGRPSAPGRSAAAPWIANEGRSAHVGARALLMRDWLADWTRSVSELMHYVGPMDKTLPPATLYGDAASMQPPEDVSRATSASSAPAVQAEGTEEALRSSRLGASAASRRARIHELPALLGVPAVLPLEGAQSGTRQTLDDAVALAVINSLDVKASAARLESFSHTARAAFGALLPKLDGRAGFGSGTLSSVSLSETRSRKEGTLSFRQALFDLPSLREYTRQEQLVGAATLQWQGAVSNASLESATAYLQALQARLTLELGGEYERRLAELLQIIADRTAAGGASVAERDRVRARVSNARSQQADARASLRIALRNLASLTRETPSRLELSVPQGLELPALVEDAQADMARSHRELLAARAEAQAMDTEARTNAARMAPTVALEVTHSRARNAAGSESYSRDTRAMLVVNWSLGNGGTDWAQVRASVARKQEKDLRADDVERRARQDIEAAYAALDVVGERFAALSDELQANRTVVEAFQAQLRAGNRPLLDVLDAYQRQFQNKVELSQLMVAELQSLLRVAHYTGRLLGPNLAP